MSSQSIWFGSQAQSNVQTFPARFDSWCILCRHRIRTGQVITVDFSGKDQAWHAVCPTTEEEFTLLDGDDVPMRVITAKYSQRCQRCDGWISIGEDCEYWFLDKLVAHVACPEPEPLSITPGFYTVVLEGTHRTFRIRQVKTGSWKGRVLIGYLFGTDNQIDYTECGTWVGSKPKLWENYRDDSLLAKALEILADPASFESCHDTYARMYVRCYRCGAPLTNPESIAAGLGPVCIDLV